MKDLAILLLAILSVISSIYAVAKLLTGDYISGLFMVAVAVAFLWAALKVSGMSS